MSSSSSEEHDYYSSEEVDFSDEPALPDTSKFSYISEEELQAYIPAMVLPSGEVTPLRVFLLPSLTEDVLNLHLNFFYRSGYR